MKIYCDELLYNIEVMQREISKNSQKINDYDKVNTILIIRFKFNLFIKNIIKY